ncbi:MAG: hypothetical protein HYV63_29925 [Candidatus Schekmanbacteria bacterium]|nr:hypothetical protein [Candidatus Schekmanbacteria bacterium]
MARPSRSTQEKRSRERARQEKLQEKRQVKLQRKEQRRSELENRQGEGDPDLEGIVPGPQPLPEWVGPTDL